MRKHLFKRVFMINEILDSQRFFQAYRDSRKTLEDFLMRSGKNNLSTDEHSHWEYAFKNADDWESVVNYFSELKKE